jgi:oxygen-independent coproporphyrinogen-3 oxidase
MITADTLGLYVSIPFCRSKCSFCNFASNVYAASHHARYIERVCEELRSARLQATAIDAHLPAAVDTIYLGGGTPSVLEPELLHQLFATIRSNFEIQRDAEITMECAPGQIDDAVLAAMVECGVNCVSLGVQSFVDREAATTGRLHNRATALADIARLRTAGIHRINLDLIAGLPHQTLASWHESLDVLVDTGVQHASVYMLEVDDDSRLGKELLQGGARYHAGAVPKDDTIATMFEIATAHLSAAGIEQYEISNYAVPGEQSKHNLKYWTRQPYLGIGLDAHSMLRRNSEGHSLAFCEKAPPSQDGVPHSSRLHRDVWGADANPSPSREGNGFSRAISPQSATGLQPLGYSFSDRASSIRFAYTADLDTFLEQPRWQDIDPLTPQAELEEAWFLGLRLNAGVSVSQIQPIARFLPTLAMLEKDGLLRREGDRITLTPSGQLLSNEVFAQILEVGDEQLCPAN